MDIQHGDRAAIRNIRFENIRVEIDQWNPRPRMQGSPEEKYQADPRDRYCPILMEIVIRKNYYSKDDRRGTVRDVVFKDIEVTGPHAPRSSFRGFDAGYGVEGVKIANLRLNGKLIGNAHEARLHIGPHVGHVQFSDAAPPAGNRKE